MLRAVASIAVSAFVLGSLAVSRSALALDAAPPAPGAFTAFVDPNGVRHVTDVFLGRGAVGPYLLSWRNIVAGSEVVTRGAQRLAAGADYKLDPASGTLAFTTALRQQEIARVDYGYDPTKAAANTGIAMAPMQFNLLGQSNGAMSLSALFRPDGAVTGATSGGPAPGLMMLSLSGNARLAPQSSLASKLFLDARGGNVLDRSGILLTEKTKAGFGQVSVGFKRGGAGFVGPDDSGITAGSQVLDASASLNAVFGFKASATFRQTTDLPESGKGAVTTAFGQSLTGSLAPGTRLQASRTQTTVDSPEGDSVARTATRIQLDQTLGAQTQATLLLNMSASASGDSHTLTQTSSLSIRSQPSETVTVTGSLQNKLSANGPQDTTHLQVDAQATPKVKVSATIGDQFDSQGALHQRQAAVQYSPIKAITLNGSFMVQADGSKETLAHGFSADAVATRYVQFSGGVKLRDGTVSGAPDPDQVNTYNVKLSVGLPSNVVRVTGSFARNPEDERGAFTRSRSEGVNLQSRLGQFDLSGAYSQDCEDLTSRVNTSLELKLGWRLAPTTQILTAFKELQTLDGGVNATDSYSLTLSHRLGSLLDLSLSGVMTTYLKEGIWQPVPDYQAQARVGVRF